MKSKPSNEHYDAFASHVVATLPDSLRERKTLLVCLLAALPKDHGQRQSVKLILEHLRAHDAAQLEFTQVSGANGGGR